MSLLNTESLKLWLARFHEFPAYFEKCRLTPFFKLATLFEVDYALMSHMRDRWNPVKRTFHIGNRRICPTVEDFRALLLIQSHQLLHLQPLANAISFKSVLRAEFGMARSAADMVFKNGVMNLQKWHDLILRGGQLPDEPWVPSMLITILLAHYVFTPATGQPSIQVFAVMLSLRNGPLDIAGMVLAETIMGLNNPTHRLEAEQRGSSFLLYLWVADKVKSFHHTSRSNPVSYDGLKEQLRTRDFCPLVAHDARLREMAYWYGYTDMISTMGGLPRVILHGLETATCYYTGAITGQFGRSQLPLADVPAPPFDEPITMTLFRGYDALWNNAFRFPLPPKGRMLDIDDYIANPVAYRRACPHEERPKGDGEAQSVKPPPVERPSSAIEAQSARRPPIERPSRTANVQAAKRPLVERPRGVARVLATKRPPEKRPRGAAKAQGEPPTSDEGSSSESATF